ncbi:hypothetical protein ABZ777_19360 [Micromonospora parva]|uniref:hypothetical protein n=1 Tax=Micromonospora parva TaxID=1464048 RepID=UPI0033DE0B80
MADRITPRRAVYAHNLGVPEDEAESIVAARAGAPYAREAFLVADGPGWSGTELFDEISFLKKDPTPVVGLR